MDLTLFPTRPLITCFNCPYVLKAYTIWSLRLQCAFFYLLSGSALTAPAMVPTMLYFVRCSFI